VNAGDNRSGTVSRTNSSRYAPDDFGELVASPVSPVNEAWDRGEVYRSEAYELPAGPWVVDELDEGEEDMGPVEPITRRRKGGRAFLDHEVGEGGCRGM